MKLILVVLILSLFGPLQAQDPKELEFNTLPCTVPGAIGSDGKTCTEEDVKKFDRRKDKFYTNEEKRIDKLSDKKDPLKIQKANKKRSRGIWVSSGGNN